MERPLVLAMSPRVGRSNHRYFAPSGSTITEREAATLTGAALDSKGSDDSIVSAEHMVSQIATGRVNPEILLVRDARLAQCADDVRRRVESILSEALPEFGRLITGLTETEGVSGLLIRHKRFDELSDAILRKSAAVMEAAEKSPRRRESRTPVPAPEPTGESPRKLESKPRLHGIGKRLAVVACAFVAAAFVYITFQTPTRREPPAPQPGPQPDSISIKSPAQTKPSDLKELHSAVLRRKLPDAGEFNAAQEIIYGLNNGLVFPPPGPAGPPSDKDDEIRDLLAEYFKVFFPDGDATVSLEVFLNNSGFVKKLDDLFRNHQDAMTDIGPFRCSGPSQFDKVFNAFVKLQEAIEGRGEMAFAPALDGLWQREFIAKFPKGKKLSSTAESDSPLRLYGEEDAAKAREIAQVLGGYGGSNSKLPESIAGLKGPDPVTWLREKLRDSRDGWGASPLKEALEAENKKARNAFQKLKALGDVWADEEGKAPSSTVHRDSP